MSQFDAKIFNPEVFGRYVERVPDLKKNELLRAGVLRTRNDLKAMLNEQTGGNYITIPMKGLLDGTPLNYDGATNITSTGTKTYSQSMIVVGRAKAWTEKDFSYDITGTNFMGNVAEQVGKYWQDIDQDTLISILTGIFSMSGQANERFVNGHTTDITSEATTTMGATTLNSAIQKACGDNKKVFSVAIMHSIVATNLENLQLLDYLKYTDKNGIQRDLGIATLNGRLVLIDDSMPTSESVTTAPVYSTKISTAATAGDKIAIGGVEYTFVANDADDTGNKIKVGASGTAAQQAANIAAKVTVEGFTITQGTSSNNTKVLFTAASGTNPDMPDVQATKGDDGTIVIENKTETPAVSVTNYTTFVLGDGAFDYCNCGAKVPYEMQRDPATNGGQDTLYTRQRKLFAPKGISFTKASMSSLSPTDSELKNGANWELVNDGALSRTYINHKAIPIARIISRG